MKKFLLSVTLLGSVAMGSVYAQHTNHPGCGSNIKVALDDPEFAKDYAKFNEYVQQHAQVSDERAGGYRIMPVVVHVIHNGGNSNVSNASINTMIQKMNQAYSKTPPNINTLPTRFDTIAGEAMIEFRLATKDPLGNCTDGIRRVYAPQKSVGAYDDKKFKSLSYWDRAKYLNIWIVNNITDPSDAGGGGTILGYCLFPGNAPALSDGATIAYGSMTTQGVVAHEVGHHLNLIHMWGDAVCGDDQVDDTPIHREVNFAIPNPCDTVVVEADCYENVVDNYRDSLLRYAIGENYQNYMDYVNNYNCPNMFTNGQIARMNATFAFYPYRGSVVTEANNIITGTQDNAPPCTGKAPIAEFWPSTNVTCAGSAINFVNGSFNGTATSWAWEFEGGTPATSNVQNPQGIVYNTPGTYGVTLTVSNADGSHTKTKTGVVFIMDPTVVSKAWGYSEGFEGENYDMGPWTIVNDQTEGGKSWKLSPPNVAYTGGWSIKMDNFKNVRDNNSDLISPAVDMDAISGGNKVLRFKIAYAVRTNENFAFDEVSQNWVPVINDRLTLSRSVNCGASWTTVKNFSLNEILSAGLSPAVFNPNNLSLWKQITVNLNGPLATGNDVRFRFHFNSGGPVNNNLFIDDIQIIATTGPNASIDEATAETLDFNVYPNPLTDNSVVTFTLPESVNKANVGVYDIAGRFVANIYTGELTSGIQTFTINRERLNASGVYFVKLDLDGKVLTRKIIAQ